MTLDDLQKRYIAFFGIEPTKDGELDRVEAELAIRFPQDFKEISKFYMGGIVGLIEHKSISEITEETIRLRHAVGLPHNFVVLAELTESLIVMNTNAASDAPVVIWCDAGDVYRLGTLEELHNPKTWTSYAEFFNYLLDEETEEREQSGDKFNC